MRRKLVNGKSKVTIREIWQGIAKLKIRETNYLHNGNNRRFDYYIRLKIF